MKENKKINLIPIEVRERYFKKYVLYVIISLMAVFALITMTQFGRIGITSLQISAIENDNARYDEEKANIQMLKTDIEGYKGFMRDYENKSTFPFVKFMCDIEMIRPDTVQIISIDSDDRLVNEGNAEDEAPVENETDVETAKIEYIDDLYGKSITIRGYSSNQDDLAAFIYCVTKLAYINNTTVTGIEEHTMFDGEEYNIFEIRIVGGAVG